MRTNLRILLKKKKKSLVILIILKEGISIVYHEITLHMPPIPTTFCFLRDPIPTTYTCLIL